MCALTVRAPTGPAALGALLLSLTSLAVHAGRPLQTEDAGVLGKGECELEAVLEQASVGPVRARAQGLGVGCGVVPGLQLGVAVAAAKAEGERARGAAVGGKWRLAGGDDGPQLALTAGADWVKLPGTGWQQAGAGVGLVASLPAPGGTVHLGIDHGRDRLGRLDTTSWGVAFELDERALGTLAWAPMAEWVGDDRDGTAFNLGLRLAVVADRLWLDASRGRRLSGDRERLVTLGLKLAF
jgi:hypothetical protein